MSRVEQINFFYEILRDLEERLGGKRRLADCHGRMHWPRHGVYFFFELGESRSSGHGLRVVRVGTHALKRHSKATLWERLRAHRGNVGGERIGGGDHRGSIFRLHVGSAILRKDGLESQYPSWGVGSSAPRVVRDREYLVEKKVSQHIREMPFLWLKVEDPPGPQSQRAYIEQNAIALLSNYDKLGSPAAVDAPSADWLGFYCTNSKVRRSGLWNVEHITEQQWDPEFLNKLEETVGNL